MIDFATDREAIIESAIQIYHANDISMEEAMDTAINNYVEENSEDNDYEANEASKPKAGYIPVENRYGVDVTGRVATHDREYADLAPGLQRAIMQGILKWIDDYNLMEEGPAKEGLAYKIYKTVNDPFIRNLFMKSGYWNRIPEGIRKYGVIKKNKKYARLGRKVQRLTNKGRFDPSVARSTSPAPVGYAPQDSAYPDPIDLDTLRESVIDTALDIGRQYNLEPEDAIQAALEEYDLDASIFDDDYDDEGYYE
jgi:hypothetical protein